MKKIQKGETGIKHTARLPSVDVKLLENQKKAEASIKVTSP